MSGRILGYLQSHALPYAADSYADTDPIRLACAVTEGEEWKEDYSALD